MPHFIDRRLNPKDKSLGSRQRFIRRARAQIKEAVDKAIKGRSVIDTATGETVSIPTRGISEPTFHHTNTGGRRRFVRPGNREFRKGDQVAKPPQGGNGKGGKEGADHGEGEDSFQFALTREEFLDLFFEGLELPDLLKKSLKEVGSYKLHRAGYSVVGTPTNINVLRTMRNSFGRRLALKRPRDEDVTRLQRRIFDLEAISEPSDEQRRCIVVLHEELEALHRKRRIVAFVDPLDIRFNFFEKRPEPNTSAVMFCLMDTSASMGEREKDLAKRFFVLLHLFLKRRYERIEVVFISHTHESQEVDEETFFYSRETGGTVVSTALVEMQRVVTERFPRGEWNIYAAQASDGENVTGDSQRCVTLLSQALMPLCQYYAYVEILDEREADIFHDDESGAELWRSYRQVHEAWPNFAMKRITGPGDIYSVFRELFARKHEKA